MIHAVSTNTPTGSRHPCSTGTDDRRWAAGLRWMVILPRRPLEGCLASTVDVQRAITVDASASGRPSEQAGMVPITTRFGRPTTPPASRTGSAWPMSTNRAGANRVVERISARGWGTLHLDSARSLIDEGQAGVNEVAAIPSHHAALTVLPSVFLWRRVHRRWRLLLAAYPLIMAFSLVYSAEHYALTSCWAGWRSPSCWLSSADSSRW